MPHPYKENGRQPGPTPKYVHGRPVDFSDLDGMVNRAVQLGTRMGSEVLDSISSALQDSINGSMASAPVQPDTPEQAFKRCRRRLDSKLANRCAGWLTAGITGCFFAFGCLVTVIVMASLVAAGPLAPGMVYEYRAVFEILAAVFAPLTAAFGVLGWLGIRNRNYFARLRRYLKGMRGWTGTLAQLARNAVIKPDKARRDLQKAVANGHLGAAYYDAENDTLYLDESLYQPAAPEPQPAAELSDSEAFAREGAAFLAYLRSCRGHLGPGADEELDAMERICTAILGFVHNHPEQLARVRRFRDYYLPTTRKLLDTALGLPNADTANAQTIRRDIVSILHTLNMAFAKLYDTLLQEVSLDISAEIDTLETMLGQDGLTHDFQSDFGARDQTGPRATMTGK